MRRKPKSWTKSAQEALQALDRDVADFSVSDLIDDVQEDYEGMPDVVAHLAEMRDDILENLGPFRAQTQPRQPGMIMPGVEEAALRKYEVNVLVDNTGCSGVIWKLNP